jgi:hypothetical protein
MKTLTNPEDFTGSIRISNSRAPQRELETSIQPLKKPTANHLLVILKRVSVRIFKISKCFHRSKQKLKFPFSP